MMLKIVAVLWTALLIEARRISYCEGDVIDYHSRLTAIYRQICKVSPSSVTDETWYQEEAVLKVIDGIFLVELLEADSAPLSLNADGKRIVELHSAPERIPSLKRLSLENNLIERIDGSVFEGFPNLVYLNLARNRITYLNKDSFQGLAKLQILNLNHNSLSFLGNSINDDKLPALTRLYLQHNNFQDKFNSVEGGSKRPVDEDCSLRHLYLSNNLITSFSEGGQLCLKNLTHLFLEDNELSAFSTENMPLRVLSLDGNDLRSIPTINSELKFLSLARNDVSYIPKHFSNADNLAILVLSYNKILIPTTFKNLPSLEHLAIDHNFITAESMPFELFHNLTSLKSLDLTGNKIALGISPKQFVGLHNLEKLYLGSNGLISFPGNKAFGGSKLRYLDLSNNTIENFSDIEANTITELEVVKLTGNPLRRIDPNSVPNQLTILF